MRPRFAWVLAETPWIIVIATVSATFAFRHGMPAFRHDWIWVSEPHGLVRWFVDNALSEWNPHGLGNAGQIPTFNLVLAPLAVLGEFGWSPSAALWILLVASFGAAYAGIVRAVALFDIDLDPIVARSLALAYAFGPIAFQKVVAGHIFWLAAFAALPWFAASVRRGCTNSETLRRDFAAASLLFAISSTQIQFVAFDLFVLVVILLAYSRSRAPWIGAVFVVAVGLFHNANAILAPLRASGGFFLERVHGTLDWEHNMSAAPLDLARLSGYVGYDTASLTGFFLGCLAIGKSALLLTAVVGIAISRDRRALVFGVIAAGALCFASGWDGPLRQSFEWALFHLSIFTVFRELFHVMALYAFATTMLAALALARFGRRARWIALPLAASLTLPFTTLGLNRLVPAVVTSSSERDVSDDGQLRALLPDQEPIAGVRSSSGGVDPARFVPSDAASGDSPLVIRSVLDGSLPEGVQRTLLADLGIDRVLWRADRVSVISQTFEPHVGATYAAFDERQRVLQRRFATMNFVRGARSVASLEAIDRPSPLRAFLADDMVPPGRSVDVLSSFYGNDIRRQWVSGRLWAWFAPRVLGVMSDPIFTSSSAPLALVLDAGPNDTVYLLAATHAVALDGRVGTRIALPSGPYSWYRWHTGRISSATLRGSGFTSVARCIVSPVSKWVPPIRPTRTTVPAPTALPYAQSYPWSASAVLPRTARDLQFVYARSFSPEWHLAIDGRDVGPARRVDGIFNGWIVPPGASARRASLSYAPQVRSGVLVALDVMLETMLLAVVFVPLRRRAR